MYPVYPIYSVGGITLSEIPGKTALIVEFANCQQRCPGCHSQHLWDPGESLNISEILTHIDSTLSEDINCILLMGGTTNGITLETLKKLVEAIYRRFGIPVAIYSGLPEEETRMSEMATWYGLDFLKTGDYREDRGGLEDPKSNQKLYKKDFRHTLKDNVLKGEFFWEDITYKFRSDYA